MENQSTLNALVKLKCPKCHEGNLFVYQNPYNLKQFHLMHKNCEKCGECFEPEPGFYTGAMYINYGFAVLLTAITYLILEIGLKVSAVVFFSLYISIIVAATPLLFRYSRAIFLYMVVRYDHNSIQKQNGQQ